MSDTPRTEEWLKERAPKRVVSTWSDVVALADFARQLEREVGAKQAQIDRLLLEFCPDEMTPEQTAEWAKHQRPVEDDAARPEERTQQGVLLSAEYVQHLIYALGDAPLTAKCAVCREIMALLQPPMNGGPT